MRDVYHVAKTDFLQRVRSRRLLAVLAVVAYLGYLVNVGEIELVYQHETVPGEFENYYGEPTSALVGAKAALTSCFFFLFAGYYLLKNTLARDRDTGVDLLAASMPISDGAYLLGKWLSNVGVAVIVVGTLGLATVINHVAHGIGPTNLVDLLLPLFVLGIPAGALIGAIALLFETIDILDSTLGNVAYFFLAIMILGVPLGSTMDGTTPDSISLMLKLTDFSGTLAVYEATESAILGVLPGYTGGPPSFGQVFGGTTETYQWVGGTWPDWMYLQRAGFVGVGFVVVALTTLTYDRFDTGSQTSERKWLSAIASATPFVGRDASDVDPEPTSIEEMSLTPVTNRNAGGIGRLVVAEFRLALRGQKWWWYVGAASLLLVGLAGLSPSFTRDAILPAAFIWPIFIWSSLGTRPDRHQVTPLVLSSNYSVGQLLSSWFVGVVVTAVLGGGVIWPLISAGETGILVGYVAGVLFVPSLAVASGMWSRSSRLFEIVYLLIWYTGPVNGIQTFDFLGVTSEAMSPGVPLTFIGIGAVALAAAVFRRYRESQ